MNHKNHHVAACSCSFSFSTAMTTIAYLRSFQKFWAPSSRTPGSSAYSLESTVVGTNLLDSPQALF